MIKKIEIKIEDPSQNRNIIIIIIWNIPKL